jgi:tetratricopeptide (TPR) repeat protein
MELEDGLYTRIQALSQQGNAYMEAGEWPKAVRVFQEALALLPPPPHQWEAATWLYASIGDAYYMHHDYANAQQALWEALNGPEGLANPFIHLRLGEVCYELGDHERAKDSLLRAYILEGPQIFAHEPPYYLTFLRQHVQL